MERFRNKYRTRSPRARWWDYSRPGAYFITICTKDREHLFGTIIDKLMVYTPMGEIVLREWDKSFMIRLELFCEAFVLMPDHSHAIVRIIDSHGKNITDQCGENTVNPQGEKIIAPQREKIVDPQREKIVDPHGRADQPPATGVAYRPPKSISSFIAGFKSAATKQINEFRNTPGLPVWQSKFYDHIIQNEQEYQRIKQYIIDNPANWGKKNH